MKKVIQKDLETNEIIRVWDSLKEAGYSTEIDFRRISDCYRGVKKSAGGYKWEKGEDVKKTYKFSVDCLGEHIGIFTREELCDKFCASWYTLWKCCYKNKRHNGLYSMTPYYGSLKPITYEIEPQKTTEDWIREIVFKRAGLSSGITSKCRDHELVRIRQLMSYLLRKYTKRTYHEIANLVGYRQDSKQQHTMAIQGERAILRIIKQDSTIKRIVKNIESQIENTILG